MSDDRPKVPEGSIWSGYIECEEAYPGFPAYMSADAIPHVWLNCKDDPKWLALQYGDPLGERVIRTATLALHKRATAIDPKSAMDRAVEVLMANEYDRTASVLRSGEIAPTEALYRVTRYSDIADTRLTEPLCMLIAAQKLATLND